MKKFWVLIKGGDIIQKMEYLKIPSNVIKYLYGIENSDLMVYIKSKYSKKFIISFELYDELNEEWGWGEYEDYGWYIRNGYKYKGEINLRKYKLLKLNEKILENKK